MLMKKSTFSAVIFALITISTGVFASQATPETTSQLEDQRQQSIDLAVAPIRSAADVDRYMSATPGRLSPLSALSPAARQRFIASLRFNSAGLASYSYQDIEAELTASQAYAIMSLFGVQRSSRLMKTAIPTAADKAILTPAQPNEDYRDFSCGSPATCIRSPGDICIGKNC